MAEEGLIPNPFAAKSLKDKMITAILEWEEEGHMHWTPSGMYARVAAKHPDLYPPEVDPSVLVPYGQEAFLEEVALARKHRFASRLPAYLLADTLYRRVIDLVSPILFTKLNAVADGEEGASIDMREARMLLKDALLGIKEVQEALVAGQGKGKGGASSEKSKTADIDWDDAMALIAQSPPERREIIAKGELL